MKNKNNVTNSKKLAAIWPLFVFNAKDAEKTQRKSLFSLCGLCDLCVEIEFWPYQLDEIDSGFVAAY
jgi:hypothetical protein